eukprot:PhF_6_TR10038/c0_g1_i2/m.15421
MERLPPPGTGVAISRPSPSGHPVGLASGTGIALPSRSNVVTASNTPLSNSLRLSATPTPLPPPPPQQASNSIFMGARSDLESRVAALEQELDMKRKVISRLEAESIGQMRTIAEMRATEDSMRSKLAAQARKDVDGERERANALASELANERDRRTSLETRVQKSESELHKLPNYEARVLDLEKSLGLRTKELEEIRRQRSTLEQKVVELQGSNQTRVLEGKVSALQALLEDRAKEVEEEARRANATQTKVDDLKEALSQMQRQISVLERWKGENAVLVDQQKREIEKCEQRSASLGRELESSVARCLMLENAMKEQEVDFERRLDEVKQDVRNRAKQSAQVEAERTTLQERVLVLEKYGAMQQQDFEAVVADRERYKSIVQDLRTQLETTEGNASREATMCTGLKEELERQRKYLETTMQELRELEKTKLNAERTVYDLEQELRRKAGLEERLENLGSALDRVEQDRTNEIRRHEETKRQLLEHEERSRQYEWTTKRLRDTEMEMEARSEAVDTLNANLFQLQNDNEAIRNQLEEEIRKVHLAQAQSAAAGDIIHQLEGRVFEAEKELSRMHGLEGKVFALDESLNAKSAEISSLTQINNELSLNNRDLGNKLQEIPILEERIRGILQERNTMQTAMDSIDDARREAERHTTTLQAKVRHLESDIDEERSRIRVLEDEISQLKKSLVDKTVLESQLGDVRASLSAKTEEYERCRGEFEDQRGRIRSLDDELQSNQKRRSELEEKLAAELRVIEEQQLQIGKLSVTLESSERERNRLTKDVETRIQQHETMQGHIRRLQDDVDTANEKVRSLELRESRTLEAMDDHKRRCEDLEIKLLQTKSALNAEGERVKTMDTQVHEMREQVARAVHLDGKVAAMEKMISQKDAELAQSHSTLSELRLKIKEMEGEIANAQKLEQRYKELRAQAAHNAVQLEQLEHSDASKSAALSEKEKELHRLDSALRATQNDLAAEQGRRSLLERRIVDLEGEQAKKAVLDGRITGLESLLSSRAKELETEREENAALRGKLRGLEKDIQQQTRYEDIIDNFEHELRLKNDVIQRLESEESRRRTYVDQQRAELEELGRTKRQSDESTARMKSLIEELQRTVAESRADNENIKRVTTTELQAKETEIRNLQFSLDRAQQQLTDSNLQSTRTQERNQQLEEELWQAKRAVASAEHDRGAQAVSMDDLQRQMDSERTTVKTLTESLTIEREKNSSLEIRNREIEGMLVANENRVHTDKRVHDEQVMKLEDYINRLNSEFEDYKRKHAEMSQNDTHRIYQLEQQLRAARDECLMFKQNADETLRALKEQKIRSADSDSAAEERLKGLTLASQNVASLEKKLKSESEVLYDTQMKLRQSQLDNTQTKAMVAELQQRHDIDIRECNSRIRSLTEERDALRLQIERLRVSEYDRISIHESTSRIREMAARPSQLVRTSPPRPVSPSVRSPSAMHPYSHLDY